MPGIYVGNKATRVYVLGYGIRVDTPVPLTKEYRLCPPMLTVPAEELAARTETPLEHAAILTMGSQASFAVEVGNHTGKELAVRAWNSLWLFGLIELACRTPCVPLVAFTDEADTKYSLTNRNLTIRPLAAAVAITTSQLSWIEAHLGSYYELVSDRQFNASIRYLTNSFYLFDFEHRLMLLWAGIEGLLGIDGELRRRLALHAAILLDGTPDEKAAIFSKIKKAYDTRSKVVHGGALNPKQLVAEHKFAEELLSRLLAKCVELKRVPTAEELDAAALRSSVG